MSFSDTYKVLDKPSETNSPGSVQDIIDLTHDGDVPVVASALRPLGCPLASISVCKDLSSLAYFTSLCLTLSGTLATHSARFVWQLVNALQSSPGQDRAEMLLKRMERKVSIITSGTRMSSEFSHTRSTPVYQAAELLRSVCDASSRHPIPPPQTGRSKMTNSVRLFPALTRVVQSVTRVRTRNVATRGHNCTLFAPVTCWCCQSQVALAPAHCPFLIGNASG
jgi:hypothetical protein